MRNASCDVKCQTLCSSDTPATRCTFVHRIPHPRYFTISSRRYTGFRCLSARDIVNLLQIRMLLFFQTWLPSSDGVLSGLQHPRTPIRTSRRPRDNRSGVLLVLPYVLASSVQCLPTCRVFTMCYLPASSRGVGLFDDLTVS